MLPTNVEGIAFFILMGVLGGFTYVIIKAKNWSNLYEFKAWKRYLIGGLCGFIYNFLYSEHNFPNGLMSLISGYMGTDFILSIVQRYREAKKHG